MDIISYVLKLRGVHHSVVILIARPAKPYISHISEIVVSSVIT